MIVIRKEDPVKWCHKPSQPPVVPAVTRIKVSSHHSHRKLNGKQRCHKRIVTSIHAPIGLSNTDRNVVKRNFSTKEEDFFSFSSILSSKNQRKYQRSIQPTSSTPVTHITPSYHSIAPSQINHWSNADSLPSVEEDLGREYDKSQGSTGRNFVALDKKQSDARTMMTNPTDEYGTIYDVATKRQKRRRFNRHLPCACSKPCILLSCLISLLVLGAILGGVVGILTTLNKKSTTITTLTSTMITPTICSCLCPGESWRFDSGYLARWTFDGTLDDLTNNYNATPYNNPSFVTNGYVNQALYFNPALAQSLSAPYIPLAYTSFTVEVWLKPTFSSNFTDYSIFGLCPSATPNQCLHIVIRKSALNHYLYFGFFGDDCQGNTTLNANQWIHAAFVFDMTTMTQSVYLDGKLDGSCTASSPISASNGSITIGTIPLMIPLVNTNYFEGCMDHLTVTKRAKSACEIQEDATLAGCFLFDTEAPYTDFGPNSLGSTASSTSIISSGHRNGAISFNGTGHFQASPFTALGDSSKSFSMVLWIQPRSLVLGTVLHVSSDSNGTGWCFPFMGIDNNGSILGQIFYFNISTVWGPQLPTSPVWSHIVQTWSPTNGLRLYVNGVLVGSLPSAISYLASGASNFVTLASALTGQGICAGGGLSPSPPGPLDCDIDDFRVYSRELTTSEISIIHQT